MFHSKLGIIAILIGLVPAGLATAEASATPLQPTVAAPQPINTGPQGIIMSDGRICNPRWGC